MTIKDLTHEILDFSTERDWTKFHSPKNLAMAVASEAGELLAEFRWSTEIESNHLDADHKHRVEDEIGDVLICLLHLASKLGIDPLDAAKKKLQKNKSKYPVEKVMGTARKYDQF